MMNPAQPKSKIKIDDETSIQITLNRKNMALEKSLFFGLIMKSSSNCMSNIDTSMCLESTISHLAQ